jgi:Ala-tRNA(Pro) deacylase
MAQVLHVPGDEVAKTVLLRADDKYRVAVLPATRRIDLEAARRLAGASRLELATEPECLERFPDCEIGAVPPFGSLYGMKTLIDTALAAEAEIVFEGNSHAESIRMRYEDYAGLERPLAGRFSYHA